MKIKINDRYIVEIESVNANTSIKEINSKIKDAINEIKIKDMTMEELIEAEIKKRAEKSKDKDFYKEISEKSNKPVGAGEDYISREVNANKLKFQKSDNQLEQFTKTEPFIKLQEEFRLKKKKIDAYYKEKEDDIHLNGDSIADNIIDILELQNEKDEKLKELDNLFASKANALYTQFKRDYSKEYNSKKAEIENKVKSKGESFSEIMVDAYIRQFNKYAVELENILDSNSENMSDELQKLLTDVYRYNLQLFDTYSDTEKRETSKRIATNIRNGVQQIKTYYGDALANRIKNLIAYGKNSCLKYYNLGKNDWIDKYASRRSAELNEQEKIKEESMAKAVHYSGNNYKN